MTYTKKIIIIEHRLQQTLSLTQKLSNQLSTTKTHSLTTHLNSATMFTDFNFTTFNIYNLNKVEKEMLVWVLDKTNDNRTEAAEVLGISRRSFYSKLKKHKLK